MEDKVRAYAVENHMFQKGDGVVVGVSGGADSTALFVLLSEMGEEWGLALHVVHVHHGLRGGEADEDEAFVRKMVEGRASSYRLVKEDVRGLAHDEGLTLEEAGRLVRYKAFHHRMEEVGGRKIAVAHNQNDQAETVLFQLCRGSGLRGLTGMAPVTGAVVRPLLCADRGEIEGYLRDRGVRHRQDSTNADDAYTRNRIRNQAIPLLESSVSQGVVGHIARAAGLLRECQEYIEISVEERFQRIVKGEAGLYSYKASDFLREETVLQKELVRRILRSLGTGLRDVGAVHVEAVRSLAEKAVGKRVDLPGGIMGVRTYECVRIGPLGHTDGGDGEGAAHGAPPPYKALLPFEVHPPCELRLGGEGRISFEINDAGSKNENIPKNNCTKHFDYDKIKGTVFVRTAREGDYFIFDAEGHKKKLSRHFIDEKIPKGERAGRLVVAEGSHILWLLGGRMSEDYKVDEGTRRVLVVVWNGFY